LALVADSTCVLRYDSEAGKGDHRHIGATEEGYNFVDGEALSKKSSGMTLKHGDVEMKTLTLEVATLKDVKRRARDAFKGTKQGARISFATPEQLFQLMTTKRLELIRKMTGAGPLTIREAARRVDRDVKGVHGDVHTLLNAGILRKTDASLVVFPFDVIRVAVELTAAPLTVASPEVGAPTSSVNKVAKQLRRARPANPRAGAK
jgi:predicted transcriptional regulator